MEDYDDMCAFDFCFGDDTLVYETNMSYDPDSPMWVEPVDDIKDELVFLVIR